MRSQLVRRRLLLLTLWACGMTALGLGLFQWDRSAQRNAIEQFDQRSGLAGDFISSYLDELVARQRRTAEVRLAAPDLPPRALERVVRGAGHEAALLLGTDGRVLQVAPDAPQLIGADLTDRYTHLRQAVQGRVGISSVVASAVKQVPITAIAVPFATRAGTRVMSAGYDLRETPIGPYLMSASAAYGGTAFLLDAQGALVASSSEQATPGAVPLLTDVDDALAAAVAASRRSYEQGGERQLLTRRPVGGTPWRLVMAAPAEKVLRTAGLARRIWWILGFALCGLVGLAAIEASLRRQRLARRAQAERERFLTAFEQAPAGMALADRHGRFFSVNAAFCQLTGLPGEELMRSRLTDLVEDGPTPLSEARLRDLFEPDASGFNDEVRLRTAPGDSLWVSLAVSAVHGSSDEAPHLLVQVQSVEARKELEAHLRRLAEEDAVTGLFNRRHIENEIAFALKAAQVRGGRGALMVMDLDNFKEVNDGYGHEVGDQLLTAVADALRFAAPDRASVARLGGDEFAVLLPDAGADESAEVAEQIAGAVRLAAVGHGGDVIRTTASIGLAFFGEIEETGTELVTRADLAMYDAKAAGRDQAMTARTPRSRAAGQAPNPSEPVTVVHCDDSEPYRRLVKEMLAAHGDIHVVGEATSHAEAVEVAAEHGPDVVLLDLNAVRRDTVIAELRAAVPHARIVVLSGMADTTGDPLVAAADDSLSKSSSFDQLADAVRAGGARGARAVAKPSGSLEPSPELGWLTRIKRALSEQRFVLYAQPIIDLASGAAIQHELLIRMVGEEGEIIAPGQFLPTAERYGLVAEIDRWVLSEAVKLAARGHAVEINISGDSLADPDLGATVEREIRLSGADPRLLAFEITETSLARNKSMAAAFAERVRAMGSGVALDDFGTGYAGFTYLKNLPVNCLKIDMEFVTDLATDVTSQQVVRAVAQLAKGLGLDTVAEGVEDRETAELLTAMGVDAAQGYHFARPAPALEVLQATSREWALPGLRR